MPVLKACGEELRPPFFTLSLNLGDDVGGKGEGGRTEIKTASIRFDYLLACEETVNNGYLCNRGGGERKSRILMSRMFLFPRFHFVTGRDGKGGSS